MRAKLARDTFQRAICPQISSMPNQISSAWKGRGAHAWMSSPLALSRVTLSLLLLCGAPLILSCPQCTSCCSYASSKACTPIFCYFVASSNVPCHAPVSCVSSRAAWLRIHTCDFLAQTVVSDNARRASAPAKVRACIRWLHHSVAQDLP